MGKNLRRAVVAATAIAACLTLLASPASASIASGTVTAGTITFRNASMTTTDSFSLANPCSSNVAMSLTPTGAVTQWEITTFATVNRIVIGGGAYVMELMRTASTSGTVTGGTTLNTSTLTLSATFYVATGGGCPHGTTRACRFAGFTFSLSGSYSGNVNAPAVGDTFTLSAPFASLGTASPPCTAPFTAYIGGTVSLTGLTVAVTSVV